MELNDIFDINTYEPKQSAQATRSSPYPLCEMI